MDSIWVEIFLIGVSILANAFFAGSEIALVSARPSRLSQLRAQGVPGAEIALKLGDQVIGHHPAARDRRGPQAKGSRRIMVASRSGPVDTIASGQPASSSSARR